MIYGWRIGICVAVGWAGLGAAFTESGSAQVALPIVEHPVNPAWVTVETVYQCDGEVRRFSVRHTNPGFEFLGGTRKGTPLSPAAIARATQALGRLDAVSTMVPQCAPSYDFILVLGLIQGRHMSVFMTWQEDRLWISEPQPSNF
jgi:hypothetical protein